MHPRTSHSSPSSLASAAATLLAWAERQHALPPPPTALRYEIPVAAIPSSALLPWLRAHPSPYKLFFRAPQATLTVAAVGFALQASSPHFSPTTHARLVASLDPTNPAMRLYGGMRFDPAEPSSEWAAYTAYTFVLPAVELVHEHARTVLAVNYHFPTGIDHLRALLSHVVAPSPSLVSSSPAQRIARAASVTNLTSFAEWDAAMHTILSDLRASHYQKIVLARRKAFHFISGSAPAALDVLAALDGAAHRATPSGYLFCLQLDHTHAFLGATPERLFRQDRQCVHTEALAATVRRTPGNDVAARRALHSTKNRAEHDFVVDAITAALRRCGLHPVATGPHARELPRLMHLATHITSENPVQAPVDAFRLLAELHPTPAVCGVPREDALVEIRRLERFDRGLFAGPFGWFTAGASEFCVAIRSALMDGDRVIAYAGCGIVPASESRAEWDEAELKLSQFIDLFSAYEEDGSDDDSDDRHDHGDVSDVFSSRPGPDNDRRSTNDHANHSDAAGYLTHNVEGYANGKSSAEGHTTNDKKKLILPPDLTTVFDPCKLDHIPNINALWSFVLVDELCRNGVDTFFVCPGSRSAPLAVAITHARHANLFVAHDERGAGFLALGYARATGRAAAVVTTSGTAVANLLPAAVEASMDSVPLLLLTADRPPELLDVGANQAIDQPNIFGRYPLWSRTLPCPTDAIPLRAVLRDVDYAVHMTGSPVPPHACTRRPFAQGVVHLNMMFREKLAPDVQSWDRNCLLGVGPTWRASRRPMTLYTTSLSAPCNVPSIFPSETGAALAMLRQSARGIVLLARAAGGAQPREDVLIIREIAARLHWPLLSDICGGLRLYNDDCDNNDVVVHHADLLLASERIRDRLIGMPVLQFGERVTSKRITTLIQLGARCDGFVHVVVASGARRVDEVLSASHRVFATAADVLSEMGPAMRASGATDRSDGMWLAQMSRCVGRSLEERMPQAGDGILTEPWVARVVTQAVRDGEMMFVGNSMAIRDVEMFGAPSGRGVEVVGNRGASGIDGLLSTAIGLGVGGQDVIAVVGDMSTLHDLNALHALGEDARVSGSGKIRGRVRIVVVNNSGGGIFAMLPIGKHEDVLTPAFDAAHDVRLKGGCAMFKVRYCAVRTVRELREALCREMETETGHVGHEVIEAVVSNDHGGNAKVRKMMVSELAAVGEAMMDLNKSKGVVAQGRKFGQIG